MMERSYNRMAMIKFILVVVTIGWMVIFHLPIANMWVEWMEDIIRFGQDPVFYASYSFTKKMFYAVYPLLFIVFLMLWYVFSWKQHRKNYYSDGFVQGTVMWVFNKPGKFRGHIYDLFSIFNGFKEIEWENINRPITGKAFDGSVVIYWRSSFFQPFTRWNKDVIIDPEKNFRESFNTIYAYGSYRTTVYHKFNPSCDFNILTGESVYHPEFRKSLKANMDNEDLARLITTSVQRMARANPEVANAMSKYDIPIKETRRLEYLRKKAEVDVSK